MQKYKLDELFEFLKINDKENSFGIVDEPKDKDCKDFLNKLENINAGDSENRAVLGFDIFRYSKFEFEEQKLIPVLFRFLLNITFEDACANESVLKKKYTKKLIEDDFIDTGDGGFLLFDNPLDAIMFSIYFYANLHMLNSFHEFPILRKTLGKIIVRSSLTFDKVYSIGNNFYGPGIIANSRIMSRDKLDRLLIDENTYEWFLRKINGIEHLFKITDAEVFSVAQMNNNSSQNPNYSFIFKGKDEKSIIRNIFCQRLEQINVKEDSFSVYNLILQYDLVLGNKYNKSSITCTIGNLNCIGI